MINSDSIEEENIYDSKDFLISKSYVCDWDEWLCLLNKPKPSYTKNLTDNLDIDQICEQLNKSEDIKHDILGKD